MLDENDNIIYQFPKFYGETWIFLEIEKISFQDVNEDGKKDVIVIADYMAPAGENAGEPFSVTSIYFQKDKEFINLPEFDEKINSEEQNINLEMLLNYTREHLDEIQDEFIKIQFGE